jgi:CBS domain-containing protein
VSSSHRAPRVWDVMSRDVVTVNATSSAASASSELRRDHLAGLPVVNDHMEVVGSVRADSVRGRRGRSVAEVMARPSRTIDEVSTVSEAADLLLNDRLESLLVVSNRKLVGRISRRGMVAYLSRHEWVCSRCGSAERGSHPPGVCPGCGALGGSFQFEDAVPGN